jgi:hypothetical protein
MLFRLPRLVKQHLDTITCLRLLKPLRGCREHTPHLSKDSFSILVQLSMPARVRSCGAFFIKISITQGLMPSKVLSLPTSSLN